MFLFCSYRGFIWRFAAERGRESAKCQTAYKPGSVLAPSLAARRDGWPFIWDARCRAPRATYPDGGVKTRLPARGQSLGGGRPYLVLLPVGFALPSPLPETRCALAAPFRPYRHPRGRAGGLLSVALSLGSPPPGVTRHRISMEPGLSSSTSLGRSLGPEGGHPAVWRLRGSRGAQAGQGNPGAEAGHRAPFIRPRGGEARGARRAGFASPYRPGRRRARGGNGAGRP